MSETTPSPQEPMSREREAELRARSHRGDLIGEEVLRELFREIDILRAEISRLTKERDAALGCVVALEKVLKSAYPHPTEHPTMTAAWEIGNAALAKWKERHK